MSGNSQETQATTKAKPITKTTSTRRKRRSRSSENKFLIGKKGLLVQLLPMVLLLLFADNNGDTHRRTEPSAERDFPRK